MALKWLTKKIDTTDGVQDAIAPWIISASRATDIPAYYSDWFFDKIEKGYAKWVNPFNRSRPQYISFANTQVIVFWSKNPEPLVPYLNELDKRNIKFYFQFTVNDYENESFEPNLPSLEKRLETFKILSEKIGKEKVIWRFDPLLLSDRTPKEVLVDKISRVGDRLHPFTEKLVFSFADITNYRQVQNNLKKNRILYQNFDLNSMEYVADNIREMNRSWNLKLATCGEEIDFEQYGIDHNKCIDDELILRITEAPERNQDFEKFVGYDRHSSQQLELFTTPDAVSGTKKINLKDKGQRKECGCIYSKDIGSYDTCVHGCIYCYANSSQISAQKNKMKTTVYSEALLS